MSGEPYPKSRQLARGDKRYRRKVASPKQWAAIRADKLTACRVCGSPATDLHHLVIRTHLGDDVAANLVPLCRTDHGLVTLRNQHACEALVLSLTDDEYSYMISKAGEGYPERAYGIEYRR